jgi:hypothetical protein
MRGFAPPFKKKKKKKKDVWRTQSQASGPKKKERVQNGLMYTIYVSYRKDIQK